MSLSTKPQFLGLSKTSPPKLVECQGQYKFIGVSSYFAEFFGVVVTNFMRVASTVSNDVANSSGLYGKQEAQEQGVPHEVTRYGLDKL
ncbi:MAG: hypothetical protein V3R25_10435 [Nitrosomonadaceae bacterium]